MKLIVSIISSLLVGLTLGASNFSPLMELQRLLANRKKVLYSVVLAATAFIFVIASIMLASIESALQFQNQGMIGWTPLLTVAGSFFVVGLICMVVSRAINPLRIPQIQPQQFGQTQTSQILEYLMKSFVDQTSPSQPEPTPRPAPAPQAPPAPSPAMRPQPSQAATTGPVPTVTPRASDLIQH